MRVLVDRADGRWGRVCVLLLLAFLVVLVPLAAASPPDPLWIGGIYDAADSDDAVLAATSLEYRVEEKLPVVSPVSMVVGVTLAGSLVIPFAIRRSTQARAPPRS
jgi:hypothetical protein